MYICICICIEIYIYIYMCHGQTLAVVRHLDAPQEVHYLSRQHGTHKTVTATCRANMEHKRQSRPSEHGTHKAVTDQT